MRRWAPRLVGGCAEFAGMQQLWLDTGVPVQLGAVLAKAGEGTVRDIMGTTQLGSEGVSPVCGGLRWSSEKADVS